MQSRNRPPSMVIGLTHSRLAEGINICESPITMDEGLFLDCMSREKITLLLLLLAFSSQKNLRKIHKITADFWYKDHLALKVISLEHPCHKLSKNIWIPYVSFNRTQDIND